MSTYKNIKAETKSVLKSLATDIRGVKNTRKPLRNEDGKCIIPHKHPKYELLNKQYEIKYGRMSREYLIGFLKQDFRHLHIAYCEFFLDRTREEIEPKTRESNITDYFKNLNESVIADLKKQWKNNI